MRETHRRRQIDTDDRHTDTHTHSRRSDHLILSISNFPFQSGVRMNTVKINKKSAAVMMIF